MNPMIVFKTFTSELQAINILKTHYSDINSINSTSKIIQTIFSNQIHKPNSSHKFLSGFISTNISFSTKPTSHDN